MTPDLYNQEESHPRKMATAAERIGVTQEWTDARTENTSICSLCLFSLKAEVLGHSAVRLLQKCFSFSVDSVAWPYFLRVKEL